MCKHVNFTFICIIVNRYDTIDARFGAEATTMSQIHSVESIFYQTHSTFASLKIELIFAVVQVFITSVKVPIPHYKCTPLQL